jgi:hypothetical protein
MREQRRCILLLTADAKAMELRAKFIETQLPLAYKERGRGNAKH